MENNNKRPLLLAKRKPITIRPDNSRVITKPFIPGSDHRTKEVVNRVLSLSDKEVKTLLEQVLKDFSGRHRHFKEALEKNYMKIEHCVPSSDSITAETRLLLGSYFTCEYSVEGAALFNPSIVLHPDQKDLPEGSVRFIMSFRATGEGHISSIEFWSGKIDSEGSIDFDPISKYVETPELCEDKLYNKHLFGLKLAEMRECNEVTSYMLGELGDTFTFDQLQGEIARLQSASGFDPAHKKDAIDMAMWLARSNYEIKFRNDNRISERVIFPVSENESKGIEDARFVHFTDDDGSVTYYATYTAYNGFAILPQLITTKDFITFKVNTLNGKAVQNKGMALFPRKIDGKYVMLSRQDGVNNHIMFSENIHFWQESEIIQTPTLPWEFIQIGNCGSPIETDEGWLLLTHGVGAMRKYNIGIELLDLNDPSRIIGRLDEPILVPTDGEEGYVPNVVYSCGAMIHNDELVIPFAIADQKTSVATISVPEVLSLMNQSS